VLISGYGFTPDDAFAVLAAHSQHSNVKVHEVARAVVEDAAAAPASELTARVDATLARYGS